MESNRRRTGRRRTEKSRRQVKQIDVLPDEVLLEIFDFFVNIHPPEWHLADWRKTMTYQSKPEIDWNKPEIEAWKSLIHVCRRWRNLVLGSPRRLDLQLYCTPETPARDTLDVWPALPLIVEGDLESSSTDNIITALGQSNRVFRIIFWDFADRQLEEVLAVMQVPFPELTELELSSSGEIRSVIPDSFLVGSAPRLRIFTLGGIPFPGLPRLLLSATHLVELWLSEIPHSGYISPEAIVSLLSALSSLKEFHLGFRSPQSRPDQESRHLPPPKRSIIPALTSLRFRGVVEYIEDLVTRIDTPQLDGIDITFFNQIDFFTPRLAQFINRTPKLGKHDAHVQFDDDYAHIILRPGTLEIAIACGEPDWQLSSIEQVCNSALHPLSTVEDLYIEHKYMEPVWKDDAIDNTLWLQVLLPFTAVKDIYLSEEFAPGIAAALQELGGGRTEVLPSLQNIFVEGLEPSGPFQKTLAQLVAARQLSDHSIAIAIWDKDSDADSTW